MGPAVMSLGIRLGFLMRRLMSGKTTRLLFQTQCEKVERQSLGRCSGRTLMAKESKTQVPKLVIIVFLFLMGGVRQKLFSALRILWTQWLWAIPRLGASDCFSAHW